MSATPKKLRVWWKKTRYESDLYASGAKNPTLGFILHAFTGPRERTRFVDGRGFVNGFDQSVLDELTARGYDVTTLRFQVRGYEHLWIVPGQLLQHRTTRAWVLVHHVRWERGVGRVMLVPYIPSERVAAFDEHVKDVARRLPYVPIADVERDYTCFDHPCSWLSREARALLRPWCQMCGRIHVSTTGSTRNPIGKVSSLDRAICVGFGIAAVYRDSKVFADGENERRRFLLTSDGVVTLRRIEKWIRRHGAGGSRWTAAIRAPLWDATWERRRPGKWVCVEAGEGFA